MCTVSMIYDYARDRIPGTYWSVQNWPDFQRLVSEAQRFDLKTGQPDCEDPAKADWARKIEERLKLLEIAREEAAASVEALEYLASEPVAAGQPDWEVG